MTEQPEALRHAQALEVKYLLNGVLTVETILDTAHLLREQHNEIEKLREEVRKWQKSFGGHLYVKTEDYAELVGERDAFKAENEALRRDAELGRWIREETPPIEEIAARVDGMEDEK